MAKAIYVLKMSLLSPMLGEHISGITEDNLHELAEFISLVYAPYWFTCQLASEAAIEDLNLFHLLTTMKEKAASIVHKFLSCTIRRSAAGGGANLKLH